MAIALDPKDGKTNNAHGLVLGRPEVTVKAIAGLRRATELQRAPIHTLLASPRELRETLEPFTELRRDGKGSDTGTEGFLEVAGDLQRLIEKYRKEITQLEAEVEEVKHKHDILMEASRLLEEEAPIPHQTLYEKLMDVKRKE